VLELVQCHLDDKAVLRGKIGFTTETPAGLDGACDTCGRDIRYAQDRHYPILAVACLTCPTDWIPLINTKPRLTEPKKPATVSASESPASSEPKPTCPSCGGVKKGRGFSHRDGCAIQQNKPELSTEPKPTCPSCGGVRRGRGFSHRDGCAIQQKPELSTEPKPTCPSCRGIKRGRGFSHRDDCAARVAQSQPETKRQVKAGRRTRMLRM
jgi:hypothetical protein